MPGLVITTTNNPATLAAAVVGDGCTLTGTPTYSGNALAAGTYTGGDTTDAYPTLVMTSGSVGSGPLPALESGIIIANGKAADAKGPNTTDTISTDFGPVGVAGDTARLTFQVIPAHATLHIEIAFGSDEWTESFPSNPDAMFIYLNGVNIAMVPGTSTPINAGTIYPGGLIDADGQHAEYWTDFYSDVVNGQVQYDGMALFYFNVPVTPGATYTLAIEVADVGAAGTFPGRVDSGVFVGKITSPQPVASTRVTQLAIELLDQPAASARVTQFGVEVVAQEGIAPQRVTQVVLEILSQNRRPPFVNAATVTGLTWIIVTLHSGLQYVWSDRPLPDPATYYLGWKEPRVTKWGRIRRALSSILDGQYESTDFRVTLDDDDHLLHNLGDQLVNATVAVYMIPDEGRRRLETPSTVYRGVIRDAVPSGTLVYDLTIKDMFAEAFSTSTAEAEI